MSTKAFNLSKNCIILVLTFLFLARSLRLEDRLSDFDHQDDRPSIEDDSFSVTSQNSIGITEANLQFHKNQNHNSNLWPNSNMWSGPMSFYFEVQPNKTSEYVFLKSEKTIYIKIYLASSTPFNIFFTYSQKNETQILFDWYGPYNNDGYFEIPPASNIVIHLRNFGEIILSGQVQVQMVSRYNRTGLIIGLIVGGIVLLLIIALIIGFCIYRRRKLSDQNSDQKNRPNEITQDNLQVEEVQEKPDKGNNLLYLQAMNTNSHYEEKDFPRGNFLPYKIPEKEQIVLNPEGRVVKIE